MIGKEELLVEVLKICGSQKACADKMGITEPAFSRNMKIRKPKFLISLGKVGVITERATPAYNVWEKLAEAEETNLALMREKDLLESEKRSLSSELRLERRISRKTLRENNKLLKELVSVEREMPIEGNGITLHPLHKQ